MRFPSKNFRVHRLVGRDSVEPRVKMMFWMRLHRASPYQPTSSRAQIGKRDSVELSVS